MAKVEAIIFDLGNVVFDVSLDNVFSHWAQASGKPKEEIKLKFRFDKLVNDFSKGKVTAEEFRTRVIKKLGITLSSKEFDQGWNSLLQNKRDGIDKLLKTLKLHYRLVALSNTNIIHHSACEIKYADTLKIFEKVFCSYQISAKKPEKEAYYAAIDFLNISPKNILLLDDNISNLTGARKLGIQTIHVESFKQMEAQLQQHKIFPKNLQPRD